MLLSFLNVTQRFGPFVALDRVSCELNGRAIGLLGPNGAGKTTLMKVCLGLIAPDRTPPDIINGLSEALQAIGKGPDGHAA